MSPKKQKELSKHLSYVLRYKPGAIGIELDENGWASIGELIANSPKNLTAEIITFLVENNDKKRFVINDDDTSVRANQGHSINIDLALDPKTPPHILYHGTATRFLDTIMTNGLKKMNRQHVHLSVDLETASKVGLRHGKLVILSIDAARMHEGQYKFYQSENGVWLTDIVPTEFLSQHD